jgi:hypothetical protein
VLVTIIVVYRLILVPTVGTVASIMSAESEPPQWVIRILFGRYRTVSTLTWTDVIILAIVGVITVYVYLFFLRLSFASYDRALRSIPRTSLPLSKKSLSRKMFTTMLEELIRVDTLIEQHIKPEGVSPDIEELENKRSNNSNSTVLVGDPGWGKEGSRFDSVHFNTSIAKSYLLLESTALSRRPGLFYASHRTIRSYVKSLQKAFPGLTDQLCEDYIATYERAVFGDHKFTIDEYNAFMSSMLAMVTVINEKVLQADYTDRMQ